VRRCCGPAAFGVDGARGTCDRCTSASATATSTRASWSHRTGLDQAPDGYETFNHKQDDCVKVVLKP
jgi:threonine dehydrogenase-like Zn-dependent dehydrogenase